MKIIIAPDSFKGCLTNIEAAFAIEQGVLDVMPDAVIDKVPMADGGEGTMEALVTSTNGEYIEVEASDPLGRTINGKYGILGDGKTSVIEMSVVSGLINLKEEERNPLYTTTYGTGQLIKHALESGCRKLIVCIGGSATNDLGAGVAQALGIRFFMRDKTEIIEKICGCHLGKIASVDLSNLHPAVNDIETIVACDVRNPLLGDNGSARLYSLQKGATPDIVEQLEENMKSFIDVAESAVCKSVRNIPGAGAAGGLGAGLMLFLDAELFPGTDIVMDACSFTERIKDADIILTGEGKIDEQTAYGKTIAGIAARAKAVKVPVIAFAGKIEDYDSLFNSGVTAVFPICQGPISLEQAISDASFLLRNSVKNVMRVWRSC